MHLLWHVLPPFKITNAIEVRDRRVVCRPAYLSGRTEVARWPQCPGRRKVPTMSHVGYFWRSGLPAHLRTRLKEAPSSFRTTRDVLLSASHVAATALLHFLQHQNPLGSNMGAPNLSFTFCQTAINWYKYQCNLAFWMRWGRKLSCNEPFF